MVKSDLYRELLPVLNAGRIELLDNPRLVSQLCALERRTARGGRDSIDHPPGAHDDIANSVAGVAALLSGGDRPRTSRGFWELTRQRSAELGIASAQRAARRSPRRTMGILTWWLTSSRWCRVQSVGVARTEQYRARAGHASVETGVKLGLGLPVPGAEIAKLGRETADRISEERRRAKGKRRKYQAPPAAQI
jgi:hypothetical protein